MQCPRCKFDQDYYSAPKGKTLRNPAAEGRVYDDCKACNGTGEVPTVVLESIRQSLPKVYAEILLDPAMLRWSGDHYSFVTGGMYVGVELDGYLHT